MTKKSLARFADVKKIFDEAAKTGGGTYRLETNGKAIHWRQRAYTFRKQYHEQYPEDGRYEQFTMRIEDTSVIIEVLDLKGEFIPGTGAPVDMSPSGIVPEQDEELLAMAERLKRGDDVL